MVRVAAAVFGSIRQSSILSRRSRSCLASTGVGAVDMRSTACAVFGNAMTSRIDGSPARIATMRSRPRAMPRARRAVLQRLEEEAEPELRVLVADAEQREHPALKRGVVNADAAAANLAAVQHEVVGLREHAAGVLLEPVHVGLDG